MGRSIPKKVRGSLLGRIECEVKFFVTQQNQYSWERRLKDSAIQIMDQVDSPKFLSPLHAASEQYSSILGVGMENLERDPSNGTYANNPPFR